MQLLLLLLLACPGPSPGKDSDNPPADDADGDGYTTDDGDCDDGNATIYPGAPETWYDGQDADCDGSDDFDQDGDGISTVDGDCLDTDAAAYPGAAEVCGDQKDNDCDGIADNMGVVYLDNDGDGYGDTNLSLVWCESVPTGYVEASGDCNDGDSTIFPGATEVCDGIDNDCNGSLDDGDFELPTWYYDSDSDGYGDATLTTTGCTQPAGYVSEGTDCNDADMSVSPGAAEICDGLDQNCNEAIDDNPADGTLYYTDADGDGYGDESTGVASCTAVDGMITQGGDCDDTNGTTFPYAEEWCDGDDNDCDLSIDESSAVDVATWYQDADGDGYGDVTLSTVACDQPAGYTGSSADCDDTNADISPAASERCDEIDNDCDGLLDSDDPGVLDSVVWYEDLDSDGYGNDAAQVLSCVMPTGYVGVSGDCDDSTASIFPGMTEVCNDLDDDCNGSTDDSASDAPTWYQDVDADGYGDAAVSVVTCDQPANYVGVADDCDDTLNSSYPGATEVCDGVDNDCNGAADEPEAVDAALWNLDSDSDGYGDPTITTPGCTAPAGYVGDATDCDDSSSAISPGAAEMCNDLDDDCDAEIDEADAIDAGVWYTDSDGDTYGDSESATVACVAPVDTISVGGDCDDADAAINPAAADSTGGDAVDTDCDGFIDEDDVAVGGIIVTEIARQTVFGGSSVVAEGQWFEIYNTGSDDIDLSNYLFTLVWDSTYVAGVGGSGPDQSASFRVDPAAGLIIEADDTLVLCATDDYATSDFDNDGVAESTNNDSSIVDCDYYWVDQSQDATAQGDYFDNTFFLPLDEGEVSVVLDDPEDSRTLDGVHWYNDATAGTWVQEAQRTIILTSMDSVDNDDAANWCIVDDSERWYKNGSIEEYGTPHDVRSGTSDCE